MSQPKVAHRYRYDPLDRLIETAGIQRFYNTTRMATEIQGTVQHSVFQSGGVLLAQTRREGTKADCTLLATDFQRSVLHGVSPDKVEPIAYNVYGHRPAHSGLLSVLGFNGERPDPVTGHYLLGNGYRAFNPVLMRFNSPDSLSPFGEGGINCYGYCGGEPINRVDPSGHVFGIKSLINYVNNIDVVGRVDKFIGLKKRMVSEVVELSEGVYQYTYKSKKGTTLVFDGHGNEPSLGGINLMKSGDKRLTPDDLIQLSLGSGVDFNDFAKVELVMCYGANAGYAQRVADLTGLKTKAYEDVLMLMNYNFTASRGMVGQVDSGGALPYIEKTKSGILARTYLGGYSYKPKIFWPGLREVVVIRGA